VKPERDTIPAHGLLTVAVSFLLLLSGRASAATSEDLDKSSVHALQARYETNLVAVDISKHVKAVPVFPNIVKADLVFGGRYGNAKLRNGRRVVNYFNSVGGRWGLQAGAEPFGYVDFLVTDKAVAYLEKSHGWEMGASPTVVVVNEGVAKNPLSSPLTDSAYTFTLTLTFDQQGPMVGLSNEGTKISRIGREVPGSGVLRTLVNRFSS
jgi:lipid-binding SYLF domain-containing protein